MVERLKRDRDMSIYTLTNIYGYLPSESAIVNCIDDNRVYNFVHSGMRILFTMHLVKTAKLRRILTFQSLADSPVGRNTSQR
jgi:hypothetical protein